jgi:hypothetical protein
MIMTAALPLGSLGPRPREKIALFRQLSQSPKFDKGGL